KNFIEKRSSQNRNQLAINNIEPIISNLSANNFTGGNGISVQAKVTDDVAITQVKVCYHSGSVADETCVDLNTTNGEDYQVQIIDFTAEEVFYQIRAVDNSGEISQMPRCSYTSTRFNNSNSTIAINEFMASNDITIADEAGEFEDWLELYNYGTEDVFLGDKYLSDKPDNPIKWLMPEITLSAGEFILFWLDENGSEGELHANFKLSAGGEFIGIFDSDTNNNAMIDGLEFGEQTTDVSFGRIPNGTGDFQTLDPTPNASNMPVSVNNLADLNIEMTLAPNPFSDFLRLEIDNPQAVDLQLKIVDVLGRSVYQKDLGSISEVENIAISNWANGLYSVILQTEQQLIFTDKLLKIK
ncbi:MAG: T9SS type A sorting domain-containing protein, partial [Saprospiraceae bacterium]